MNGKPFYSLKKIKKLIGDDKYTITRTASRSALNDFDLDTDEKIKKVILRLHVSDFYKCMHCHYFLYRNKL